MTEIARRPRILCVRPGANPLASPLLKGLAAEWVDALALHADLSVASGEVDLRAACESFAPDLVLYEALEWARPVAPVVSNPHASPSIPRALLLNCDPHNPLRPLVYRLADELRIEVAFQFGVEHTQLMPELGRLAVHSLPLFVDRATFKDRGLPKDVPISVFSAHLLPDFYAWRARAAHDLQRLFPTLLYTHPGYERSSPSPFAVEGEAYARLINRSWFSLADTTRLDYVVRKHLEIPAAGSVLVAPDSPALADYGFRDLENCILGSGRELYDKIDAVSRDQAAYEAIREKGRALVHSRYTRENWTGIVEWLACRMNLPDGGAIVQDSVLGAFRTATGASGAEGRDARTRATEMSEVLRAGRDALIGDGELEPAAVRLREAVGWLTHMSEHRFLLGVISLARGDLATGVRLIGERAVAMAPLGPAHGIFDPVELTWALLGARLMGQEELFEHLLGMARGCRHVSLRRLAWLLSPETADADALDGAHPGDHPSIHWLGQESFEAWRGLVRRVCKANGREDLGAPLAVPARGLSARAA